MASLIALGARQWGRSRYEERLYMQDIGREELEEGYDDSDMVEIPDGTFPDVDVDEAQQYERGLSTANTSFRNRFGTSFLIADRDPYAERFAFPARKESRIMEDATNYMSNASKINIAEQIEDSLFDEVPFRGERADYRLATQRRRMPIINNPGWSQIVVPVPQHVPKGPLISHEYEQIGFSLNRMHFGYPQ